MNKVLVKILFSGIISLIFHVCIAQKIITTTRTSSNPIKNVNGTAVSYYFFEFETISSVDLFEAIHEWIKLTFNNPSAIVKIKYDHEFIQCEGVEPGMLLYRFPRLTAEMKYLFNLEFEENKICFTLFEMEILTEVSQHPIEVYLYNKNGSEQLNRQSKVVKEQASRVANVLISSLKTFFVEKSMIMK